MSPAWESRNWRSSPPTAGSSPPSHSSPTSSPTKSPRLHQNSRHVDRCPVDGQVLRLGTPESIPKESVLRQRMGDEDFGDPWNHPVMVLSVDHLLVTCLQVTSKDIVKCSKSWHWAARYVPIAHANLEANKQHPTPEQPRLNLASGAQMMEASSVNVEKTILVKWSNLEYFHGDRNLVLDKESLDKLKKAKADFIKPSSKSPSPQNSPRTRPAGLSYSTNTSETRPRSAPESRVSPSRPLSWRSSTPCPAHDTWRPSTSRSKSDPVDLAKAGSPPQFAPLSPSTSKAWIPPHQRRQ
ncbi:hypothetical protein BDV97DRAFT_397848 [Delphinella strobiligena]|nr:hypothetical protein BDV97DRAFT_397848 [Delphinella strobiligena]